MGSIHALLPRLTRASREARDPYAAIEWPATLDPRRWYMSPELLSLHGTGLVTGVDEEAMQRLAFFEAVSFFSLNVHGERRLIAGIDARLEAAPSAPAAQYLRHFRAEEAKHHACFREFCERYAGGCYPDRNLDFPSTWEARAAEIAFFGRVLVFEELVDHFNRALAADDRLHPLARRINRAHHEEEGRHIAFGRAWLTSLVEASARDGEPVQPLGQYLAQFRSVVWRDFFNPDAYGDAGLDDPHGVREAALAHPASAQRRRIAFRSVDRFFVALGLWKEEDLA